MLEFLFVILLGSTVYELQSKYDYCKSIEFKGKYCSAQKKLDDLGKK